jgi:hypothetical protein
LPVQVKPTFQEPGLPAFSFPVGGSSFVGGSSSGVYDSGGSGGGSVSSGGSGDAYNTMMAQDWGSQAEAAASAMGVSATALAATCAMESNSVVTLPFEERERTAALRIFKPPRRPHATSSTPRRVARGVI